MVHRYVKLSENNSFLLFGARGTGKSTLLKTLFTPDPILWIDLLDSEQEDVYARNPKALEEAVALRGAKAGWVVIDEVQKVPRLLDHVHRMIETTAFKFALTGSSAKKLKRGAVNLLAGRAFVYHLFPLTHFELAEAFRLDDVLNFGSLPGLLKLPAEDDKRTFLKAYALTYLKEEVWSEHIIRQLDPFRKFLEIAAQCSGEILNYSKIARDVHVDYKSIQGYFQILEDTLLGFMLEPYHASVRKRQHQAPKFYFFDNGVKRALDRTLTVPLLPQTGEYGKAFEHFVIQEFVRMSEYLRNDFRFSYLRTKDGVEIDLIIERPGRATVLVEIKSAVSVSEHDTRGLEQFLSDIPHSEAYCLSRDKLARKIGSVKALPWQEGLGEILGIPSGVCP